VFEGDEITDVLARLIERDPDWTLLPSETTADMRKLLARCLTKDAKARLRDIGEARIAIDDAIAGPATAAVDGARASGPARPAWRRALPWALVAGLAGLAAAQFLRGTAVPERHPMTRVELTLPEDVEFFAGPTLSADGMKLAFIGVRQGVRQVYVRALDRDETTPVAGSEAATNVAMSPAGTQVAFVTTDMWLKRVTLSNGIVDPLVNGADILSRPAWLGDDAIVFSRGMRLVVRPVMGNDERELAAADTSAGEQSLSWPVVTDDGQFVLFTARQPTPQGMRYRLEAVPVAGGARRIVREDAEQLVSASGGWLVFKQGDALFSAPFAAGAVTGAPMRLAEPFTMSSTGVVAAAVSRTGEFLAAPPSMVNGHLVWVSMTGVERPIPGVVRSYQNPRVSPNGRLIAFSDLGAIWTLDPERGTFARVSASPEPNVGFPAWSPDGSQIYYRSPEGVLMQRADGSGRPTVLKNTTLSDYPGSFTPDGRTFVILRINPETGGDVYTMPADGGDLTPVLMSKAYEGGPQLSPDGKWLLYVSNESGRMEIYLRPFTGGDRKWSVSGDGGLHPLWSRDGRRIYYRSGQRMMAVDFTAAPDVRLGAPVTLFERRYQFGPNITVPNYSLSADGREFLMVREEPGGRHLNLVMNWLQNLGR
jgi:Tol biopolymer transport system component